MAFDDVVAREKEDRQAWDLYFKEAVANVYRTRAAATVAKINLMKSERDDMLEGCAAIADKMLEIRKQRFD